LLGKSPILIVEDEPLVALTLKASVEDAGGTVVGPVGSVHAAMTLLGTNAIAAAILDVQLTDGEVTPVAAALCALGIPVIFQSGVGLPPGLERQCPGAVFYKKPVPMNALLERLAVLITK
jgi:DNA-binding response OmpR family regulator